jgi:hypothetical protein
MASVRCLISAIGQFASKRARFGLRTLLIAITLFAVGLGWLVQRVERQRRAVEAIERRHGRVVYAHEYAHDQALLKAGTLRRTSPEAPPPGPAILSWLSPHYFQRVENVYLDLELDRSGEGWPLGDLPGVKRLLISRGQITKQQLRSISQAHSLEELHLINTRCEMGGKGCLSGLWKLKQIDILSASFSAEAFRDLCNAPSAEHFSIIGGEVEPGGFAGLPALKNVEFVDILNVAMRDEDVQYLAAMPRLKYLNLMRSGVSPGQVDRLQRERPEVKVEYFED